MLRLVASTVFALIALGCSKQAEEPASQAASASNTPVKVSPKSTEFKREVRERLEAMDKEEATREEAPWFGKTGLPEADERELPRYLRREYGQRLSDPGSLKAVDLEYVGVFTEGVDTVHYWKIHDGAKEVRYAYIVATPEEHRVTGWGNRRPPK